MDELSLLENMVDSGLGRIIRKHPQARQAIAETAKVKLVSSTTTRSQKIAAVKANELSVNDKQRITNGQAKMTRGFLYLAKQITAASGTDELLNEPPVKRVGVTNFEDGAVPKNMNLLVDTIILEVANAAGTNVDAASYSNVHDDGTLPSAIANAEVEITVDGKVILPATPAIEFFAQGGAAEITATGRRKVQLSNPEWVKAGQMPQITLRKPGNGALYAADNTFLRVTLEGEAIVTR